MSYVDKQYFSSEGVAKVACEAYLDELGYDRECEIIGTTVDGAYSYHFQGNWQDLTVSHYAPFYRLFFHYPVAGSEADYGHSCSNTQNPINISNGNKFYSEVDYEDKDFRVTRYYNSFSKSWSFNYTQKLVEQHPLREDMIETGVESYRAHLIRAYRPDGKVIPYEYVGSDKYQASIGIRARLTLLNGDYLGLLNSTGTLYETDELGSIVNNDTGTITLPELGATHQLDMGNTLERYDIAGRLLSIRPKAGAPTELHYEGTNLIISRSNRQAIYSFTEDDYGKRLAKVTLPSGDELLYGYNWYKAGGWRTRLETVKLRKLQNGEVTQLRKYFFQPTNGNLINSVEDADGNIISSVAYDYINGAHRATKSEKGPLNSGLEIVQLQYNEDGSKTLTNALGKKSTYHFVDVNGELKVSQVEGLASANCAGANKSYTYDDNGFMASKVNWQGGVTTFVHNNVGQELSRTEAAGTPQARTITTEWHSQFNLPIRIVEPDRETTLNYDTQGRLLSRQVHHTTTSAE